MNGFSSTGECRVAFITLGCAKNEVDSDRMRAFVLAAGFSVVEDPERAHAVIINTCSFITEATEEAIAVILEASVLPEVERGATKIVVTGCMPSRYGSELSEGFPEVAAFVGCGDEGNIVDVLCDVLELDEALRKAARAGVDEAVRCPGSLRTFSAPWTYVKIADGCDRNCAFCTIPLIKGHYRSVPAEDIDAEIGQLVASGVREVILIAQDTGLWGRDLRQVGKIATGRVDGAWESAGAAAAATTAGATVDTASQVTDLAALLDILAAKYPTTWIRVMYLQPQGITDELLSVMAKHDNICNYLDIPLQHSDATILKAMNRKGSGEEYLALLERIRAMLPGVTLRTSVICGFPGETGAQAKALESFITRAVFDYVGVFVYSQEDGTPAGGREDQVPLRTRKARAQRLRDLADRIGFERTALALDSIQQVLVIERDPESETGERFALLGRTRSQAPEVDGMVHLSGGDIGSVVSARMVEAYCYELDGEVV